MLIDSEHTMELNSSKAVFEIGWYALERVHTYRQTSTFSLHVLQLLWGGMRSIAYLSVGGAESWGGSPVGDTKGVPCIFVTVFLGGWVVA